MEFWRPFWRRLFTRFIINTCMRRISVLTGESTSVYSPLLVTEAPVISISWMGIYQQMPTYSRKKERAYLSHGFFVSNAPASLLGIVIDRYDSMEIGRIGVDLAS